MKLTKKGFYIKPIARLNITIQLPPTKTPGQVVSNAEIIEKIKKQSLPDEFIYLRVIKTTFEFIRCEGEIENKSSFKTTINKTGEEKTENFSKKSVYSRTNKSRKMSRFVTVNIL